MKNERRLMIVALVTVTLALIVLGGQVSLAEDGIFYVDVDATGANNGTSWADAFTTLQPALDAAVGGDQIWVAAGTYKPTLEFISGDPRSATFQMKNGVAIYGGFDPSLGDIAWEDRDWANNLTILSGDLTGDDGPDFTNNGENSYHVFYHPAGTNLDNTAILDGFTITGGNANGTTSYLYLGGGMYNDSSSPALSNCTFSGNSAADGGGMCNHDASPMLTACTFTGNLASWGGGMSNNYNSSPTLTSCIFANNSASEGGGMSNFSYSSPSLTGCTFSANSVEEGGGMHNSIYSSPALTNCTFSDNSAYYGGGMYNKDHSTPSITNCTFSGNLAYIFGGGMYNVGSSPTLTNAILWADTPDEIYNSSSTPVVTYSDVQGGYSGTGNINSDPQFVNPTTGDFHLGFGSSCIDAGNNAAPNLPIIDFEGDPRILDGNNDGVTIVDMGVDEYTGPILVEIDVKPTSSSNLINLGSRSSIPVAILTTVDFDAATVDPDTVVFAGAAPVRSVIQDVDRDGDLDLLLYFKIQELDLDENSTEATLTGETFDGTLIQGTDRVKVKA